MVLHNFLIEVEGDELDDIDFDPADYVEDDSEEEELDHGNRLNGREEQRAAEMRRNRIVQELMGNN